MFPKSSTCYHLPFFLVQLEELLEPYLKNTNLGIPYWDWTKNANIPQLWEGILSPLKNFGHRSYYGQGGNGNSRMNQCTNEFSDNRYAMRVTRAHNRFSVHGKEGYLSLKIFDARSDRDFRSFSRKMSVAHGDTHVELGCTMEPLATAAYDPIFWMHHSYVDKVFAEWQHDCGLHR